MSQKKEPEHSILWSITTDTRNGMNQSELDMYPASSAGKLPKIVTGLVLVLLLKNLRPKVTLVFN